MAESKRYGLDAQLDANIEQILQEAQHRWLRPTEICEILQNYQKFRIAREPQDRPPGGSLFLFDRRVLRYFRKDGHNWRKKKDGKTVKEAHERLKAGSVDVLHCYYAHGEDNENFQRRSYWMLEEELSHIVLVHYREVKGNRTYFNRNREAEETITVQENEDDLPNSEVDSSLSSKIQPQDHQITSQITDTASLSSAQASEYEDVESAYNHKESSGFHYFLESQQPLMQKVEDGFFPYYPVPTSSFHPNCPYYEGQVSATFDMNLTSTSQGDREKNMIGTGLAYGSGEPLDFPSWNNVLEDSTFRYQSVHFQPSPSWNNVLEDSTFRYQSVHFQPSSSTTPSSAMSMAYGQGNEILPQVRTDGLGTRQEFGRNGDHLKEWQNSLELYAAPPGLSTHQMQNDLQLQVTDAEGGSCVKPELDSNFIAEERADYSSLKQPLLDGLRGGLKKLNSFDRWMSKELGDVNQSHIQSSSGTYWEAVGNQGGVGDSSIGPQVQLDSYLLGPSLSQDQYFSIIDFSPNWVYAGLEVKVLIMGRFLKSQQEVEKSKWACMFGELEVPADVIADGVLRCHTPVNKAGKVPFYVTCSNRLACSEVREFEFRVSVSQDKDAADASIGPSIESLLLVRFAKLLSFGSSNSPTSISCSDGDTSTLSNTISSLLRDGKDEWEQMLKHTFEEKFSTEKMKDQLLQKLLMENLQHWLLQKTAKGGKGPSVLDKDGQGVLHLAAALGYDWAIPPTIAAGVSVNFRDVNGWTALHWAASYGREQTVGVLISLGAASGALTDPTPKYTSGRTPADLASSNGHKGIAGYLAESALSSHLSSLKLKDKKEGNNGETYGIKAVQTVSERTATLMSDGDLPLKDSLAAVRNATQAAACIYQVFRAESFQRKQLNEYGNGKFGMSDERVLSLLAVKTNRAGQHDEPVHAAAIRIQNKFRSWKGRKEFLLTRQRIIKIQAHFRGHQVRKNYKKIIWSVGILEKVILRWRRKGSGLRGFRPETNTNYPSMQNESLKEDEYDFLKEGRKQTEERLQKALARVRSMVQYPEARDQYRRLLNVVSELRSLPTTIQVESLRETKDVNEKVMNNCREAADFDEDLVDVQAVLDDDTFMSTTL